MVIDWEHIAIKAGKSFLFLLEYSVKLSAVVVTTVVLSAKGTFGMKLGTGFGSLSPSLRSLFEAPAEIAGMASLIHEYNSLTIAGFDEQYGVDAINLVMNYLNGGITYLQTVQQNFVNQPFATFFAAVTAFFILYMISFVLRFARQRGQGSYLNKLERKLAEYVFEAPDKPVKLVAESDSEAEPQSETEPASQKGIFRLFGKSRKTNEYLQDYVNSTKNTGLW